MTTKLGLTYLVNGQANYLNANQTFALLNQLVQGAVVDKDLAAPPGSPADESLYIVAASATGAWAGQSGKLAFWLASVGAWTFVTPREGMWFHVNDEGAFYKYTGSAWAVFSGGGGSFTGGTLTSALNEAPTVTIASASTTNIAGAAGNTISITGTTTITALGTIAAGAVRRVVFTGALTLTHNATSLILPTGASITTAAGDSAEFLSLGSGNWRCVQYLRSSGAALVDNGALTNPMTSSGDMIVGGVSGAPARLAKGTDGKILGMVAGAQAWVDPSGSASVGVPIRTVTGTTGTIAVADAGYIIETTSATAVTLTLNAEATAAWASGAEVSIMQRGAGAVTVAGAGFTIKVHASDTLVLAGNGAAATLKRFGVNDWQLFGRLVAA